MQPLVSVSDARRSPCLVVAGADRLFPAVDCSVRTDNSDSGKAHRRHRSCHDRRACLDGPCRPVPGDTGTSSPVLSESDVVRSMSVALTTVQMQVGMKCYVRRWHRAPNGVVDFDRNTETGTLPAPTCSRPGHIRGIGPGRRVIWSVPAACYA